MVIHITIGKQPALSLDILPIPTIGLDPEPDLEPEPEQLSKHETRIRLTTSSSASSMSSLVSLFSSLTSCLVRQRRTSSEHVVAFTGMSDSGTCSSL